MRRNRNVTPDEMQAALTASGGSRLIASKDLDISLSWCFWLVRKFERQGMEFPRSPRKRPKERPSKVYKPTRKEIRAACKAIQAGWTDREWAMRRVNKEDELTVPWVVLEGDSRDAKW